MCPPGPRAQPKVDSAGAAHQDQVLPVRGGAGTPGKGREGTQSPATESQGRRAPPSYSPRRQPRLMTRYPDSAAPRQSCEVWRGQRAACCPPGGRASPAGLLMGAVRTHGKESVTGSRGLAFRVWRVEASASGPSVLALRGEPRCCRALRGEREAAGAVSGHHRRPGQGLK